MQKLKKKNIILMILLLAMMVVIGVHWEKFYVSRTYSVKKTDQVLAEGEKYVPGELSILGNQTVEQEFIARTDRLSSVSIDFKAWERLNGSGRIIVEVQTLDDEVLASAEKWVTGLVQKKSSISTKFSLPTDLVKGETYKFVIHSEDVVNEKGVYLYVNDYKGNTFGDLYVNGEPMEGRLQMKLYMIMFGWKSLVYMILVLVAGIVFLMLPMEKLQAWLSAHIKKCPDVNKLLARILFLAAPVMSFFIVQRYRGYGFRKFLRLLLSRRGMLNLFLFGLLWWIIYLICNRTKYTAAILVGVSSVLGLANHFVWEFRGAPIMMADIASIGTAMNVADNYEYQLNLSCLWALVYTVVFVAVALGLKSYKGLRWKQRICALLLFAAPYGVYHTQLLHGTYLKDHGIEVSIWSPSSDYAKNGCLLSFFMSYTYYKVEKPSGYSAEKVAEITKNYESDQAGANDTKMPNLIAIMNESFCDFNIDNKLETSEDFMPFIRGLEENTVKGNLYVSVFGGNTANSEFEFLTGNSMSFLPFRSMPYNTYIKEKLGSLTYTLKEQGYVGNNAVHPYLKSGWNRPAVYPLLGFENFYGLSDIGDVRVVRTYASDQSDFEYLISQYEQSRQTEDEPFYVFNVTMQNHGGFKQSQGFVDTAITITDEEQYHVEAEQYINLVKMTDDAFKELIEYFEKVEEPTIIVMFGDHQPSVSDSFYSLLFGKPMENLNLQETINKHTVPYVIWANYDIEEEVVDMSANYLSAYLLNIMGAKMTGYQKYLLDLQKKIPMITANGYRGDDGILHEPGEASEYSELLKEYQMIQYNNMFDTSARVDDFFWLKQ